MKNKKCTLVLLLCVFIGFPLSAFQGGPLLYLRADFGGGITLPSISQASLKEFNKDAVRMSGMMSSLLMSGEVEGGYVFDSERFFGLRKNHPFSALGTFVALGVGQGNTSQKVEAVTSAGPFDTFMIVDFTPVVNFGLSAKAYFFNNRLTVGAAVGGRMIADMSPNYLVYSTDPGVIQTEVGQIIVTQEMMKKMNPLMFSVKGTLEYNIPVLDTTDIVLGWYTRYNIYRPKYLTAPKKLADLAATNGGDITKPFPDYWLNSLDFGINLGFAFKL
ncbi:hypothetical protein H0R92_00245 [Treponema sp. OMZ 840]|uniref:hypothetical protein n=1 Tax=Treponema sp. OMZ 840 TaxID=244313 RepID=UPI003D92AC9F